MSWAFQYQEKKSFMNNIDPVSKLIWMVCISVLVFLYETPLPQFYLLMATILLALTLANLSLTFILRGIWIMILFSTGFFVLQLIFVPGHTVLFYVGPLPIYSESLNFATAITLRILTIFMSSFIFVVSTDPRDIVLALTQKFKVPYRFAYAIFVALRFVPTIESEARVIESAQIIRGVGKQKGLKNKVENFKRFSMPLLMGAIRRVRITANTMDSKGYGAYRDRTYIRTVSITTKGKIFAAIWVLTLIFAIVLKII
ncbi:cobalt transporter [Compostibacillus humi]|uniref:Cobalt transporter n=1 Tax=Compostibacillus humi TaxID=1245525 RepID=A0A8J2X9K0_9BACI|nr:energy-coupling factor transporter transmembrane component T [Compostibacillus humi]GFZ82106.1 cobalt transporter [Compostibacillus humi]